MVLSDVVGSGLIFLPSWDLPIRPIRVFTKILTYFNSFGCITWRLICNGDAGDDEWDHLVINI